MSNEITEIRRAIESLSLKHNKRRRYETLPNFLLRLYKAARFDGVESDVRPGVYYFDDDCYTLYCMAQRMKRAYAAITTDDLIRLFTDHEEEFVLEAGGLRLTGETEAEGPFTYRHYKIEPVGATIF